MGNISLKNFFEKLLLLLNLKNINVHVQKEGKCFDLISGNTIKKIKLNKGASATSYPYQNLICINLDDYTNEKKGLEYFVLAHELRHIYQIEAIKNEWEDKEILDLWKQNLECYKSAKHDGYENQPIELDANAFAEIIILELFGKPVSVNCDFKKLQENMIRIYNTIEDFIE